MSSAAGWSCSCTASRPWTTKRPAVASACPAVRSGAGGSAGPPGTSRWPTPPGGAARRSFPPLDRATVKALACEAVAQTELPLSRQSLADLTARAVRALGKPISRSTVGHILHADAIKPWQYEHWIFPRDPRFADKAGRVLDLYAGLWQGQPLRADDYILSADEKTSIQARLRCHASLPPAPGRPRRVEPEYERGGALQYLAAWDVRRGYVFGRCEPATGIAPFGRLVDQVMGQAPYGAAGRVFWVVDNGSSHRGAASVRRLTQAYPRAILVHTPVHASWLNQVEIYFSLVQRKVLTPNDFANLAEVEQRLHLYEELSNRHPRPFQWKFDRAMLSDFLRRLAARRARSAPGCLPWSHPLRDGKLYLRNPDII
jgi:DDE superfamily endonuclease